MEEDMTPDPTQDLTDEQWADLARLADGTLPPDRQASVEAWVAASPALTAMVDRQGMSLDAVAATATMGAPARLRARVERDGAAQPASARRRGRFVLAGAGALAATVALALVVFSPGGSGDAPTVVEAAAIGATPPRAAAPAAATPQLLRAAVDGVAFPNYAAKFGYRAVGARSDTPSGRTAFTVYYEQGGQRLAYTIVSGPPLTPPAGSQAVVRGGVTYHGFRAGGRAVVTWVRRGHTCVLSSTEASAAELVDLADWRGKGTVPF